MSAMRLARPVRPSADTHSAPARDLPAPRPPRNSQVRQAPSGARCAGRDQKFQSLLNSPSSDLLKHVNRCACRCGGNVAANAASEFGA